MDLSFPGFDRRTEVDRLPHDLSVLVAGIAVHRPVVEAPRFGRTLRPSRLLHPLDCAFNGAMAAMLMAWRGAADPGQSNREAAVYRGVSGDLQVHVARDSVAFREGAPRPDRG